MSDNQKKLNEQLINVILSDKDSDEAKLKKVKYLIRLGADVNQKVNGKSLLKIAREKGYKEIENVIKESLLKSVEKALDSGNCEIVIKEIKDVKRGKPIVSKEEVLSLGKQFWDVYGNLKSAKEIEDLILQGAYVDIENNEGYTPLMIASRNGYKDVVEVLLEGGASYRTSSLWKAAEKGHKEIVEMLLEGGADVNHKDDDGWTALRWATKEGHKEVVQLLLENGADVNIKDKYGETALMNASEKRSLDLVNILLEGGADVNIQNKYGKTALMRASDNETKKVIKEHIKKTGGESYDDGGFWSSIFGGIGR